MAANFRLQSYPFSDFLSSYVILHFLCLVLCPSPPRRSPIIYSESERPSIMAVLYFGMDHQVLGPFPSLV